MGEDSSSSSKALNHLFRATSERKRGLTMMIDRARGEFHSLPIRVLRRRE